MLVPERRCLDSAALIQNQNQDLPTIEKSLLGSKTHLSCLSYFLWLENSAGGVGAGWVERQLQGDSGGGEDRLELSRETETWGWPGQGEERRAVK